MRVAVFALLLLAAPVAHAAPAIDHVCAKDESKATCPITRVRMCGKDSALAACLCPPGQKEVKGACVDDTAPYATACVVPDATIGRALGAQLELGTLEIPALTTVEQNDAALATAIDVKTATDVQLIRAAEAWESIEGASANAANAGIGAKSKSKLAARDQAVGQAIEVRRAFFARFAGHLRGDEQRVALARSLLRRAAYAGVGKTVDPDRKSARALLDQVVTSGVGSRASRDAAFMLSEQAVRDREWPLVAAHSERVLKWASGKSNADDHAFLAAGSARLAQARLETADLARAKLALDDAIGAGLLCSPRAECAAAAASAREVLARVFAATSSAARTMAPVLRKGTLLRHERVRPLLQLADLYAKGSGTGCAAAAEEARAWEQVL